MKGLRTLVCGAMLLTGTALLITSCSKKNDKPATTTTGTDYATLTRAQIVSADSNLSSTYITLQTSDALYFKKGDVYMYQTKTGLYGKLQIDSVNTNPEDYWVELDATTFKADGSVSKQVTNLSIHGTWSADFDNLVETSDDGASDMFLERMDESTTYWDPMNNATFAKYTFAK